MKSIKFARQALAIGTAVLPACTLTPALTVKEDGQTPVVPEEATAEGNAPYVAPPDVYVPETDISKASPAEAGVKAHTTYLIRKPSSGCQPRSLNDLSQPRSPENPRNTFTK